MLITPSTAPVGSPRELLSGGSAWKARYRYEEPSTRTSFCGPLMQWWAQGAFDSSLLRFFSSSFETEAGIGIVFFFTGCFCSSGRYSGPFWPHAATSNAASSAAAMR